MKLTYHGLPTHIVRDIKTSGRDVYDLPVETHTSDGNVSPCRHCLGVVPKGMPYLVLAHRPFEKVNAYTEIGPIFLCAEDCAPYTGETVPTALDSPTYLMRGYTTDERILYGTGQVIQHNNMMNRAAAILENPDVAFVDVRSAMNNCWQGRITRVD